jgi:sugar fermentation stimulation protein A
MGGETIALAVRRVGRVPSLPMLPVTYPRDVELVEGRLLRRYKRFLADVELADGRRVTAHCVNTGAMEGLTEPGLRVWLSAAENPKRKLAWTWELVEVDGCLIGADTSLPNRLVRRLLEERRLPWLPRYETVERERRFGERSRVDFRLSSPRRRGRLTVYLEVKNCHLVYPDRRAYFPDAVSQRATHHLRELAAVQDRTTRGHVLFTCQVPGAKALRPSDVHDPTFAATAREVRAEGVRFSAVEVVHTPQAVTVSRRLPVDLAPYGTARVEGYRSALVASSG